MKRGHAHATATKSGSLRRPLRAVSAMAGEKGSAMLMTAIAMVTVLGFAALAVDGSYMYFRHTQLQDVADAAALAAAQAGAAARDGGGDVRWAAFQAALDCAARNGLGVSNPSDYRCDVALGSERGTMSLSFSGSPEEFTVQIALDADLFFGRALSKDKALVGVTSTAEIIHVNGSGSGSLVPLAFFGPDYPLDVRLQLTLSPGSGVCGNYGLLDYGPSSAFSEYLAHGYDGTVVVGQDVLTYPGVSTGQVRSAIASRIRGCDDACYVASSGSGIEVHVTEPCPRVVVVPVVGGFFEANGRSYVTVTGFIKFFIENYDDHTKVLTGWALGKVTSNYGGAEGLVSRSVRLLR